MEKHEEWRPVLEMEVRRWSQIPWQQVEGLLEEPFRHQVVSGEKKYQVEIELLENTNAHLGLSVAVSDGSASAGSASAGSASAGSASAGAASAGSASAGSQSDGVDAGSTTPPLSQILLISKNTRQERRKMAR